MKKDKLGIIYVLIAGALWGTMGVFVNYFKSQSLSSIDIAAIRLLFASIIMTGVILANDSTLLKFKLRDIWCFLGSGLISLMIFTVCYFKTIFLSSMSVAAVLLYTSPVFVIILSRIIFKEKISAAKAISCIVCIAGTALVSGIIGADTSISLAAFLLGISSGIAYALYSIFSRFALRKAYSSLTITAYTFIFATLGLLFFADFDAISVCILTKPLNCGIMILTGLITAVLPYLFYTMGLKHIDAGKASVVAAIEPVIAVIIGVIAFDDDMSDIQYLGIILVILSIIIQSIKFNNKIKEKTYGKN